MPRNLNPPTRSGQVAALGSGQASDFSVGVITPLFKQSHRAGIAKFAHRDGNDTPFVGVADSAQEACDSLWMKGGEINAHSLPGFSPKGAAVWCHALRPVVRGLPSVGGYASPQDRLRRESILRLRLALRRHPNRLWGGDPRKRGS